MMVHHPKDLDSLWGEPVKQFLHHDVESLCCYPIAYFQVLELFS